MNEYKELDAISAYTVGVRPWLVNDDAKKRDINTLTQFALYKCMNKWCTYATNLEENWEIHKKEHTNLLNVLNSKELIDNKDDQLTLAKFHECCYCGDKNQHMEMEHSGSIFQCSFCFYRTTEMDNIVQHMETYHPNADREMLLCELSRKFQPKDESDIRNGCQENVTKIKCAKGKMHAVDIFLLQIGLNH